MIQSCMYDIFPLVMRYIKQFTKTEKDKLLDYLHAQFKLCFYEILLLTTILYFSTQPLSDDDVYIKHSMLKKMVA